MSQYKLIRISHLYPTFLLLITCPFILGFVSSAFAQKNNRNNNNNNNSNNSFKPSKGLNDVNGHNINNSNAVNTRFFQSNYHQFYNPNSQQPFNKYNNQFFYPSYPNISPQASFYPGHGHGHGHYHRQIRVPGVIEIRLQGRDAEITCEFQRYIILVQGIYWHHNVEPYGSYFDTRNGFAPHVTVSNIDPWKSVLTIKDFNEDDYGPYKCISTAILPDENNFNNHNQHGYGYPDVRTNELEESKRKVRFTREVVKEQSNYNTVYDPFFHSNYLGLNLNTNLHHQVPQQNYLPPNSNYHNKYFPDNYYHPNYNQNNYLTPGYFNNYNNFNLGGFHNYNHNNHNSNWNIHAPYFKPSYSVSTIYQEVNFAPLIPPPSTLQSPGK